MSLNNVLRGLRDTIYVVPAIGSIVRYRDLKKQNTLLEQKISSNPQLSPDEIDTVRNEIRRHPLRDALVDELANSLYPIFAYATISSIEQGAKTPWIYIATSPWFGLVASTVYRCGRSLTRHIRNYDQTGKVEIDVPVKEIITVTNYKTVEV